MAAKNFVYPKLKVFELSSTQVAAGAKIYTYVAGTSTDKTTYSDQALTTANANPVIADSNGEATIWLADDELYKIVINDSDDVLICSFDNVGPYEATSTTTSNDYNRVVNGTFEDNTGDGGVPSNWTLSITSGATISIDDDNQTNGLYSLEFVGAAGGAGTATSDAFLVNQSEPLAITFDVKASAATVGQTVVILWYQSDGTTPASTASTTLYSDSTTVPTSWDTKAYIVTPGSDAKFGKVRISGSTSAGTTNYDNVRVISQMPTRIGDTATGAKALTLVESGRDYFHVADSGLTVTNASQTNPVVVTAASHGLSNGDKVTLSGTVGMTEINGIEYTVANVATNTFELSGIDGTGYTAYSSGGLIWPSITSIGDRYIGSTVTLDFDGQMVLTYHATDLVLPNGLNITTKAGDKATFINYASGDWELVHYTPERAPDKSGFVGGNLVYVESLCGGNSTQFDIEGTVTEATWESVGPTAASTDHTWTALDAIPASGVKAIIVNLIGDASYDSSNGYNATLYCRKTGDTTAIADHQIKYYLRFTVASGNSTSNSVNNLAIIPVDSDGAFDLYWVQSSNGPTWTLDATLVGYII